MQFIKNILFEFKLLIYALVNYRSFSNSNLHLLESFINQAVIITKADSNGKIGKGIKGVKIALTCKDSGSSSSDSFFRLTKTTTELAASLSGIANDYYARASGMVYCDDSGDIGYSLTASGSLSLDVDGFYYIAVELR